MHLARLWREKIGMSRPLPDSMPYNAHGENARAKFGELYDIEVEVKAPSAININDRLAAEVFQIVQEGLSNIKRHTASSTASLA